ncbi:hypothetical protein DPMN_127519 [Dreissena polymorpha]|uniref:Uncharacterized protein n=1 Tax=Dreissena polymorpha TaxID=45954 RepID=A0A9D4GZ36_DREPO|nr:hypothetical protein DPMN_127519 [Dreissena polymorpha]
MMHHSPFCSPNLPIKGHLCDFGYFRLVHVSGLLLSTRCNRCKTPGVIQVNPIDPSQLKPTQSTQVDPSRPKAELEHVKLENARLKLESEITGIERELDSDPEVDFNVGRIIRKRMAPEPVMAPKKSHLAVEQACSSWMGNEVSCDRPLETAAPDHSSIKRQIQTDEPRSTQANPSRPKSTQVDPSQPKSTQVNPSRPKSTQQGFALHPAGALAPPPPRPPANLSISRPLPNEKSWSRPCKGHYYSKSTKISALIHLGNTTTASPDYDTTTASPDYDTTTASPDYDTTTASPDYDTTTASPDYDTTTASPDYDTTTASPDYDTTTASPDYDTTTASPDYDTTYICHVDFIMADSTCVQNIKA